MRLLPLAAAALLLASSLAARGDSIDEAEAKRRGVPVAQVEAEGRLAVAQQRADDLQKQVDAVQAKLAQTAADLQAARKQTDALTASLAAATAKLAAIPIPAAATTKIVKGMSRTQIPPQYHTIATDNDRETLAWTQSETLPPDSAGATVVRDTHWTIALQAGIVTDVDSVISYRHPGAVSVSPIRN